MFKSERKTVWLLFAAFAAGTALSAAADADDCAAYDRHRDQYLAAAGAGAESMLMRMAGERGVPVEAAAFYWAGDLLRRGDAASLDALAQLTLATYSWRDGQARAEGAMTRLAEEYGSAQAFFYAAMMLSDGRGPADPRRARAYFEEARDAGSAEAAAYLRLYEACHGVRLAGG